MEPTKTTLHQLQCFLKQNTSDKAQNPTSPRGPVIPRVPTLPRVHNDTIDTEPTQPITHHTRNAHNKHIPINFFASAVTHLTTRKLMEYCLLISNPTTRNTWQVSAANEFGRLVQGVGGQI
jgi:hypothetical protein